ncbi:MAG: hypothetical protein AUG51_21135 [Acidobacteria bacterium 13_1_20CM_3_53_8]|nr:MAG: hypothetical protein AUG51_21135 [Acidobacteria bacterium 13_1_20CM_3_53_8]
MKKPTPLYRGLLLASLFCGTLFALLLSAPASTGHAAVKTAEAQRRYTLAVANSSKYDIHRLYMSSSEDRNWGPDQLGDYILKSGQSYTISDIVPGEYDVKFVDEDGDECVLKNIQIFKNTSWELTTKWLTQCEGYR